MLVKELKRIVEQSEIIKYIFYVIQSIVVTMVSFFREDDSNWPKKNIVGKQELEIRLNNDHIAFEVLSSFR